MVPNPKDMSSNLFAKLSFTNQNAILLLNVPFAAEEHVFEMVNKTRIDRVPIPDEHYEFVVAFVHCPDQLTTYKDFFEEHLETGDIVWLVVKEEALPALQKDSSWKQALLHQHPIPVLSGWKAFPIHKNRTDNTTPVSQEKYEQ